MQENGSFDSYRKTISAQELARLFLRRWKLPVLFGLIAVIAAFLSSTVFFTPRYISTARLYIMNQETDDVNTADISISTQVSKDFIEIIDDVHNLQSVSDSLEGKYTAAEIKRFLSFKLIENTRVIEVSVASPEPEDSKKIGDSVCEIAKQKMMDIVGRDNMKVVREASLPQKATKANVVGITVTGLVAGVLLGCGIIAFIYIFDNKISSAESIEKYLELSVLATIPYSKGDKK